MRRQFLKKTNIFTILIVASLLFILMMSKPVSSLVMVELQLPGSDLSPEARPRDITIAGAGYRLTVWTEQFAGRIGLITRDLALNEIVYHNLPTDPVLGNPEPWGITSDPSNPDNVWFTDTKQGRIGRITPGTPGSFVEWNIPTPSSEPRGIFVNETTGVWFTEYSKNKIGSFTHVGGTGTFEEWELPNTASQPNDIIVIGNTVYFTEYGKDRIGALNTTSRILKEFKLPSGSKPWSLTADPDGMIWFTCPGRNVIGVLNPRTGYITEHRSIPTSNSEPRGIAYDNATGNVWFTEYAGHRIAKYVPGENMFYEYPTLTSGSGPNDVAVQRFTSANASSTGTVDVWFTEFIKNRIGHISQGGPIAIFGTTSTTTVTTITSAVSGTYTAASTTTTTPASVGATANVTGIDTTLSSTTATGTYATSTTKTETVRRLSTSTLGTSTSFISEVSFTSITSTETSTTFVSTTSVTSSTTSTSTSTSFIDTTSVTGTTTSFNTVHTGTVQRTSTSTLSVNSTITTTLTLSSYLTTTFGGFTTATSTQTVPKTSTETSMTTTTTTVIGTTTATETTEFPTIPPSPFIASAAFGTAIFLFFSIGIGTVGALTLFSKRAK